MEAAMAEILETRVVASNEDSKLEWRKTADEHDNIFWKSYHVDHTGTILAEPVWAPLPGSQYLFLECPIFEALYAGTRGPGKSLTLLMDFAKETGKGYGKAWRGVLFRRQFGDLDDIVRKIEDFFPKMFPEFRFLKSKAEYMAIWPDGEALLLRHLKNEDDYEDYHGHEYPWIGFEELTQWENDKAYKIMFSCCRPPAPGVPCRVRATTNPYGVGHNWVKKRFQLPDQYGKVIRIPGEVERVAIQGKLRENFVLLSAAPMYEMQIEMAAKNPAQARAWIEGDWNVTSGGMIDDIWTNDVHVIPTVPISAVPRGWSISRCYDHGQSHPFAVQWWLESNGEPIELADGTLIGNVRGDRILWAEWYGTTGEDNEGLRMSASKVGKGIIDREADLGVRSRVRPGPADTEIWSKDSRGTGLCPADDMEDEGVYWERADKSPGSRKRGWEMFRTFLENALPNSDGTREKPGMFVCDRNRHWLDLVPPMPRDEDDPDDVPKEYEDHEADCSRYYLNWEVPHMWRRGF
jgi:hypothetical protein